MVCELASPKHHTWWPVEHCLATQWCKNGYRKTVLDLRAKKGLVLDPTDYETWSTGSFFTSPIVSVEVANTLPDDAPRFAHPEAGDNAQTVKLSAAWLIDHAGFRQGLVSTVNPVPSTVERRCRRSTHWR